MITNNNIHLKKYCFVIQIRKYGTKTITDNNVLNV